MQLRSGRASRGRSSRWRLDKLGGLTGIANTGPVHVELVETPQYGLDRLGPTGGRLVIPINSLGVNGTLQALFVVPNR